MNDDAGVCEQARANVIQKKRSHVLGCRIEVAFEYRLEAGARLDVRQVGVIFPNDHRVVPVGIDPSADLGLDHAEVDHSPKSIQSAFDRLAVNLGCISMTVERRAF